MKSLKVLGLGLAVAMVLVVALRVVAAEGKEVTLKGTITCSKCDLKLDKDKCHTVINVTEGDQKGVYYFDDAAGKKNHGKICQSPMEGSVTGTVSEEGGKKVINVSKVDFNK